MASTCVQPNIISQKYCTCVRARGGVRKRAEMASFVPLAPPGSQQRGTVPVKGARYIVPQYVFLLLLINSTLLALSTLLLVLVGIDEVQHASTKTTGHLLVALPAAPAVWPDFAAQSFYDAHLSYIVAASEAQILAHRRAKAGPEFVVPKGRYRALAANATTARQRGRGKGRGKGRGRRRLGNQTVSESDPVPGVAWLNTSTLSTGGTPGSL